MTSRLLVAFVFLNVLAPAWAQTPSGGGLNVGAGMGPNGLTPGVGGRHARDSDSDSAKGPPPTVATPALQPVEDAEEHLALLREGLRLRPDQLALGERYFDVAARAINDARRWHNRDHRKDLDEPAPELSAALVNELGDRLTALEDVARAAQALYLTLDEPQKQLANTQMPAVISALAGNPVMTFPFDKPKS